MRLSKDGLGNVTRKKGAPAPLTCVVFQGFSRPFPPEKMQLLGESPTWREHQGSILDQDFWVIKHWPAPLLVLKTATRSLTTSLNPWN